MERFNNNRNNIFRKYELYELQFPQFPQHELSVIIYFNNILII